MGKPKKKTSYRKRIYLGKDEHGKLLYRNVYAGTKSEVEELAVQVKIKLHKGIDVSADRDTFEVWAKRWLATKERKISEIRYRKYKEHVECKLEPLSTIPISKIRGYDIQDIINEFAHENPKTGRPASEKALKDILASFVRFFLWLSKIAFLIADGSGYGRVIWQTST